MYFPPPNENDTPPPPSPRSYPSLKKWPEERGFEQQGAAPSNEAGRTAEASRKALEDKVNAQQAVIDKQNAELQQVRFQLKRMTDAYESLKKQYDAKSALLDRRTIELRAAEKFLTKEDEVPAEEIEYAFRDLNSQILAIAMACSDLDQLQSWFKRPETKRRERPAEFTDDMCSNLAQIIGDKLLLSLTRLDYTENQLVVQFSMQTIMCFFVARAVDIFPFSPTRRSVTVRVRDFWAIYAGIHDQEMQSVSARWRSLGSKYGKVNEPIEELRDELTTCTIQYLSRVLLAAGVSNDTMALLRFCNTFKTAVSAMWAAVIQFAERIKERVFSTDYALLSVFPLSDYDESVMKPQGLSVEDLTKGRAGKVLCGTELGLRRKTNVGKPDAAGVQVRKDVIEKATIIFEGELDAMIKT